MSSNLLKVKSAEILVNVTTPLKNPRPEETSPVNFFFFLAYISSLSTQLQQIQHVPDTYNLAWQIGMSLRIIFPLHYATPASKLNGTASPARLVPLCQKVAQRNSIVQHMLLDG